MCVCVISFCRTSRDVVSQGRRQCCDLADRTMQVIVLRELVSGSSSLQPVLNVQQRIYENCHASSGCTSVNSFECIVAHDK